MVQHKPYLRNNEARYIINAQSCWIWQAALDKDGYGVAWRNGKYARAHNAVWLQHGNPPLQKGMVLDHTCKVRACVNPIHMEPVTHAINVRRTSRTKLNWAQVTQIRKQFTSGVSARNLAAIFSVCTATIYYIVGAGKSSGWKPQEVQHNGR